MKETIFGKNVEIDLWDSGLINITTRIILGEEITIEILEQIHTGCTGVFFDKFRGKKSVCENVDTCFGHCDETEIISYVKRNIWMKE